MEVGAATFISQLSRQHAAAGDASLSAETQTAIQNGAIPPIIQDIAAGETSTTAPVSGGPVVDPSGGGTPSPPVSLTIPTPDTGVALDINV